ncbi:rho GTPase-activating protein 20 isoform X2 [Salmo salar]|nr:rho GTPase-activating protein 20 isoform X2 [Salmo salar]XP_013992997.1 rho GTPase-activating protein 20 isoform X2 [Salmo salar]XP_045548278.1 rho GTPase-activating protein 20 isoform X2 [Salmo salar]|eukprot:XP_013992996.1 PREDICTED: rho GTPase-activating protein 20-like isoform X2 [Salmo salar]
MKVVLMNIGTSAMTTVNVDNKDNDDKVIRILTQQLRLTGRPTDYRFWVVSGREEAPYPLIDSNQKHIKRKRSLIDWALRIHGSQAGGYLDSPTTPHKLFGLSLSSICRYGNLPRPIMDLLYLLYHEGPTTTGIFQCSANAKTCRELKERLNSGNSVQLEGESVFVAASVITVVLSEISLVFSITTSLHRILSIHFMDSSNSNSLSVPVRLVLPSQPAFFPSSFFPVFVFS